MFISSEEIFYAVFFLRIFNYIKIANVFLLGD